MQLKNLNILLFILLFTSCASFENLTDDRTRPEDDEMYWNRTEEFWVTHHEPKARPVSSEDYYGNRVVLPPTFYNNYPDYNYYNRNNNYYPTYNYQQTTLPLPPPPPPQHNNPSPTINTPKPNVTHYKRNNEPQRGNSKPGVRR
jgi:hypothetical protein